MSAISKRVVRELRDKEFRNEYVASRVKRWIAWQIKAMRTQPGRKWSQEQLAEKLDTAQGNVSRIENPDYGKFTLQTLLEIAAAFDVALQVKFVDHMTFLTSTSNMSPDNLSVQDYSAVERVMSNVFLSAPAEPISFVVSPSADRGYGATLKGSAGGVSAAISTAMGL
jgi:transcriptional regulator with XRE-family HTH domain